MMARELETQGLREVYSDLLIEYGKQDPRICAVDADLMNASSVLRFQAVFPERAIDVGVAEANMIGVAAGLSAMGKIPFTHSFTPFATRRCCDQVTLSVAYAGLNVKMVGSDPGITAELNGGTHMSTEDIAIMRNIPGMVVYEPVDGAQLRAAFPQILAHNGPVYIRLLRKQADHIFDEGTPFTLGKGNLLQTGGDVSIFASGIMVAEALDAAELLQTEGIAAEIINIHTIKPLDEDLVLASTARTGCAVTAENASILNGLGGAVAECLVEHAPCPMERVGFRDRFGEVGKMEYLRKAMGLTAQDIAAAARRAVARKQGLHSLPHRTVPAAGS